MAVVVDRNLPFNPPGYDPNAPWEPGPGASYEGRKIMETATKPTPEIFYEDQQGNTVRPFDAEGNQVAGDLPRTKVTQKDIDKLGITTIEQARQIAQAVQQGAVSEEMRPIAEAAVVQFMQNNPELVEEAAAEAAPAEEQEDIFSSGGGAYESTVSPESQQKAQMGLAEEMTKYQMAGLELGAAMTSSAAGSIIAGFTALVAGAFAGLSPGGKTGKEMAFEWFDSASDILSYEPKLDTTKEAVNAIVPAIANMHMAFQDGVVSVADTPETQAALETAVFAVPEFLGLKGLGTFTRAGRRVQAVKAAKARTKKAEKIFAELGINPKNKVIRTDVIETAQTLAPPERGMYIKSVERAVRQARETEKANVDRLYDEARLASVWMNVDDAAKIAFAVRESLVKDGVRLTSPKVAETRAVLNDLENLGDRNILTGAETKRLDAHFKEIEALRRQLIVEAKGGGEGAFAAYRAKKALDASMEASIERSLDNAGGINKFGTAPLRGSAEDIAKWQTARKQYAKYKELFGEERPIINMIAKNQEAPKIVKSLLGASSLGAADESAKWVRMIKKMTGNDPQVVDAIRSELLYGIMEPMLVKSESGIPAAVRTWKTINRRNAPLMRELGLDKGPINDFMKIAEETVDMSLPGRAGSLLDLAPRFIASRFGHQIAKKGFQQNVLKNIFTAIMGTGRVSKGQILRGFGGKDPNVGVFSHKPEEIGAAALALSPETMKEMAREAERERQGME